MLPGCKKRLSGSWQLVQFLITKHNWCKVSSISHQVVCDVRADVVVDLVEHTVVVVQRSQAATQIVPLSTPAAAEKEYKEARLLVTNWLYVANHCGFS
jgi:hypothetical protein